MSPRTPCGIYAASTYRCTFLTEITTVCAEPQSGTLEPGWVRISGVPVIAKPTMASCRTLLGSISRGGGMFGSSNVYSRSCECMQGETPNLSTLIGQLVGDFPTQTTGFFHEGTCVKRYLQEKVPPPTAVLASIKLQSMIASPHSMMCRVAWSTKDPSKPTTGSLVVCAWPKGESCVGSNDSSLVEDDSL